MYDYELDEKENAWIEVVICRICKEYKEILEKT
jgi:hypothetical protein